MHRDVLGHFCQHSFVSKMIGSPQSTKFREISIQRVPAAEPIALCNAAVYEWPGACATENG